MIAVFIDALNPVGNKFTRQRLFGAEIIVKRARVLLASSLNQIANGNRVEAALGEQDLCCRLDLFASEIPGAHGATLLGQRFRSMI